MRPDKGKRLLLLSGIAGPVVYAVATVVTATLRGGFSHADQFISELGETGGRYAWLMNGLGFLPASVLILVFALTIRSCFPKSLLTTIGSALLAIFAICMFLAGVYSCDVGCPMVDRSREQVLHDIVGIIAFPAFILGVLVWGIAFLRTASWRTFGVYSLVTVAISILMFVLMVDSETTRDGTGTYQRLFLGVLFLWLIALAVRLRRNSAGTAPH